MQKIINKYSRLLTQDPTQPASQAMLYGIGLTHEDLQKAEVGIVSTGYDGNPCNMHLNNLALQAKKSVNAANLVGLVFNTIGVSDGIANGLDGMRYSLVSREIIADSIETVVQAHYYDALIAIVGCDKNMPGSLIAMGRLNRPSIMLYGGTISAGFFKNQKLNIISSFEALGKRVTGEISEDDFQGIIQNSCPGPGACGGMYTANTMASAIEVLGMSLPYSSSNPAKSTNKLAECLNIGKDIKNILEKDIKPSDIMTKQSFENALKIVMVLGGSTNAVIHLIAMAKATGVTLNLDDFQKISNNTPVLADMKPSGKYMMEDLFALGGIPAIIKFLLKEKILNGDCLSVTGKTLAENSEDALELPKKQKLLRSPNKPLKKTGHIKILYGNLALAGSVAKITGKEGDFFKGKAIVFNGEAKLIQGIKDNKVTKGSVVVIRYEGPKGAPGMPEMLKPTSAIVGAGLANYVALITDGRFSGGSHGFVVGHITPEAQEGGNIALIENGDIITIDAINLTINVELTEQTLKQRKKTWQAPKLKATTGVLHKYAKLVSSASEGCVTDA